MLRFTARLALLLCGWLLLPAAGRAQAAYPAPVEGDFALPRFRFASGETLPVLRLHYTTVGQPRKDRSGRVANAVLVMHGTTGAGSSFLSDLFAGHLFGPGQPLDAAKYYLILPTPSATASPASPATGCGCSSRSTPTTTWCWPTTGC